jgi:AcrR family transcriptional regulator
MHLADEPVARRRRGAELETAILDAAWQELTEVGYGALTLDSVAQRAGTSRPVIARRWATKPDLVRAAVEQTLRRERAPMPDTGSLRGDVVALLRRANHRRAGTFALLTSYLGNYFQETGTTPADLRASALADTRAPLDAVFERAVARGEADPARLTARVRSVPIDLFRHEALMTLAAVPDDVIDAIVDEVLLPLVAPRGDVSRP